MLLLTHEQNNHAINIVSNQPERLFHENTTTS